MTILLRLLPSLIVPWLILAYYFALKFPTFFWLFLALGLGGLVSALWQLTRRVKLPQGFWALVFFPGFAILFSFGALMFSEKIFFQTVIALGMVLFSSLYLENVFRFVFQPARYQTNAILNLSLIFAIGGLFFAMVVLFDLMIFSNIKFWISELLFIAILGLWYWFLIKTLQPSRKMARVFGIGIGLAAAEIFALICWFPVLPIYKAGLIMVFLTLSLQIFRNELVSQPRTSRWTLIFYTLVLIFLLATAKWFA
ncbi:MAG: hypothetical protein COT26_02645 [Candidatus Kerfeldbacteria bacterium CG08_land_8_20_14_0_20_43_14]|uniref:Uncharacterized protein n=1 Tax=Candidatus Kerfeldbacteria bacterium CG08_land_8_20_14_0_20_43_14 TaxID=2014246 RepID=A0A2H0YQM0_9BACT|nr:MAG: hypothetical protein COT26_02645 [Candidatus Kerfeldbacteria bacterium CG08_land_8_20_14_0_20_43_14]